MTARNVEGEASAVAGSMDGVKEADDREEEDDVGHCRGRTRWLASRPER